MSLIHLPLGESLSSLHPTILATFHLYAFCESASSVGDSVKIHIGQNSHELNSELTKECAGVILGIKKPSNDDMGGFWPERCAVQKKGGTRAWEQSSRIWKEDMAPQGDRLSGFTAEEQEELLEED